MSFLPMKHNLSRKVLQEDKKPIEKFIKPYQRLIIIFLRNEIILYLRKEIDFKINVSLNGLSFNETIFFSDCHHRVFLTKNDKTK